MKRIIPTLADSYALYKLHKEHSKKDQFKYSKKETTILNTNFNEFYTKPNLPIVEFKKNNHRINNSISYAEVIPKKRKKLVYFLLLIIPIINFIFMSKTSNYGKTEEELIIYFRLLATWNVPYVIGSIGILIYTYFKEKSYMYKKYKLLTVIIVVPGFAYLIISNIVLRAFGSQESWRVFGVLVPIMFAGFIYFAARYGVFGVRLKFHRYMFAFEDVLEFVSDSIIALDKNLNVIKYNKEFVKNFLVENKNHTRFDELIESSRLGEYKEYLLHMLNNSKYDQSDSIELSVKSKDRTDYFELHTNPIIMNKEYMGTVLVFKDITIHKKNLELIKLNQFQLIEKEQLLSLNQLIGGVAHNLKTPLMTSAGGIEIISRDIGKIDDFINNEDSEIKDINKFIDEINDWQRRIKEYLIYMSDVITAVKGQVKEYSETEELYFTIKELEEKITLLMEFQIKRNQCKLVKKIDIDMNFRIKGDINSLIQVIDNLISNAIQASRKINQIILGANKLDNFIIFYVKNFGDKIPEEIQGKIFNEMVTTKGKNGTGLGLYISKSIVKVRFKGEIYFETNEKETTFFVKIPTKEETSYGENWPQNNDYR